MSLVNFGGLYRPARIRGLLTSYFNGDRFQTCCFDILDVFGKKIRSCINFEASSKIRFILSV